MDIKYCVYKYVFDDEIVYIGKTNSSLINRIVSHSREHKFKPYLSSDVYYSECCNSTEASIYEKFLINKYSPILNETYEKYDSGVRICIDEPKWIKLNQAAIHNHSYHDRRNMADYKSNKKQDRISKIITKINCLIWIYNNTDKIKQIDDKYVMFVTGNADDILYNFPMCVYLKKYYPRKSFIGTAIFTCSETIDKETVMFKVNYDGMNFFVKNFDDIINEMKNELDGVA